MSNSTANRALTTEERDLAYYMLTHGEPNAESFLSQLALAEVTATRCPCGCASIDFQIKGMPEASPGVSVLADFLWGPEEAPLGVFIFESGQILSGIEVYGLAGDAPRSLPSPTELRTIEQHNSGIDKRLAKSHSAD
jgi:hypothetical protein